MSYPDHRLRDAATAHAAATVRLVDLLRVARGAQWERRAGSSVRTPSEVDDPTGETASDTTRLRLRASVADALARLTLMTVAIEHAADNLEWLIEGHEALQRTG
ncbi:hypothetical protein [Microbacterium sp. NPDC077486]|uniref:DUF7169 domain-containing protein n=1 Tax=Microbacterium sp. NPDC077486 TaxID=3154766 RepID=UPI00342ADFEE